MKNSRRNFIKKSSILTLGAVAASSALKNVHAATQYLEREFNLIDNSKFTLLPLPYAYDALEPHIDKATMEIHYSKHHQGYVNNLNKAIEGIGEGILGDPPTMENIFNKMDQLPVAIRNNAGGHFNHSLFWSIMKAPNMDGEEKPIGKLGEALNKEFGSYDTFKKQFADAAMKRFGSGWAWLIKTKEGKLKITSTANQDNPLMNLPEIEIKGQPILALDVWEHAYYLKNQNRRGDYISSWWNVVNWMAAEKLYQGK